MFFADVFVEVVIRILINACNKLRSTSWPIVTATVTDSNLDQGYTGCTLAVVRYRYQHGGEKFEGAYKKPSLSKEFAEDVVRHHPAGCETPVRLKPGDPETSVAIRI